MSGMLCTDPWVVCCMQLYVFTGSQGSQVSNTYCKSTLTNGTDIPKTVAEDSLYNGLISVNIIYSCHRCLMQFYK